MLRIALASWISMAAPEQKVFLFELGGVPVGTVTLELSNGAYRYESRHFFNRDAHRASVVRRAEIQVEADGKERGTGLHLEALWLWRKPQSEGCVQGREELGSAKGLFCVADLEQGRMRGSLLGQPFEARYSDLGALEEVRLARARFVAIQHAPRVSPPDFWAKGLPIEGEGNTLRAIPTPVMGDAQLAPAWEEKAARALSIRVRDSFQEQRVSDADFSERGETVGSCLAHARRFTRMAKAFGLQSILVHGLTVTEGRAYPHVWVRVRLKNGKALDLDPTFGNTTSDATHLPLGVDGGRVWLDVLEGKYSVIRNFAPSGQNDP